VLPCPLKRGKPTLAGPKGVEEMKYALPKITVITPSYNQAPYLEQTILSVLEQGYGNLEYMILDGGSTDGSVDIIKKYEKYLAYWRSFPDGGQSFALYEGFNRATGAIFAWLNSDDMYEPGALSMVGQYFKENSECCLLYGDYYLLLPDGSKVRKPKVSFDFKICLYTYLMIPQPSAFWTREAYMAVGGIDRSLNYTMDYDLFLRIGELDKNRRCIKHVPVPLSTFRVHSKSKSASERRQFKPELRRIKARYIKEPYVIYKIKQYMYLTKLLWKFVNERKELPDIGVKA
jgi:glycosyltransferase involved in cell wall biosynthesis